MIIEASWMEWIFNRLMGRSGAAEISGGSKVGIREKASTADEY